MSTCSNVHGFHRCNNLKVQNLTVLNNQQMRMATSCVRVPASHLRVLAAESSPNTDGIHISASTLAQIKNSVIRTEVFKNVMDETGHFKACLSEDIRGMLYLYEASYLSIGGESILEEATNFATKNIEQNPKRKDLDQDHALLDEMLRGDNPKSIQCYMYETSASKKDAREHIKYLIGETWKKMNKDRFADSPFSQTFVEIALNSARVPQFMYQYGDGHAAQGCETKDRVLSLLVNPIPLEY